MVGGDGWQALRPKVGGVVDVVTRKSRGSARGRISRRVVGLTCDRLQFTGCNNVVATRENKAKAELRRGYGVRVGVSVVESTKWEAGLARWVDDEARRRQQRPCTKSCLCLPTVTFGNEDPWTPVRHAGEAGSSTAVFTPGMYHDRSLKDTTLLQMWRCISYVAKASCTGRTSCRGRSRCVYGVVPTASMIADLVMMSCNFQRMHQ